MFVLFPQSIIVKQFTTDNLNKADDLTSETSIRDLSRDDVLTLAKDETTKKRFFPEGRIFAHSMYFKRIEDNMTELVNDTDANVFSSSKRPANKTSEENKLSHNLDDFNINMITTGFYNFADVGLLYEVDVVPGSDMTALNDHMSAHVRKMKALTSGPEVTPRSGVIMVTIGKEVEERDVAESLARHGISRDFPGAERYILYFANSSAEAWLTKSRKPRLPDEIRGN